MFFYLFSNYNTDQGFKLIKYNSTFQLSSKAISIARVRSLLSILSDAAYDRYKELPQIHVSPSSIVTLISELKHSISLARASAAYDRSF
jgi:hypothetical protein